MAIRAAPTVSGDASGPSAWAVPVVPKSTAARRTFARAWDLTRGLFHNRAREPRATGPQALPYTGRCAPLTGAESGEHRNRTTDAISSARTHLSKSAPG